MVLKGSVDQFKNESNWRRVRGAEENKARKMN